jgi:succinyl-CoA synthetase beta subunit
MNLHEYQAKILLQEHALATPIGEVAGDTTKAIEVAKSINSNAFVVKAQIHAGGRRKIGEIARGS